MGTTTGMAFRRTWLQSQKQATEALKRYAATNTGSEARRLLEQARDCIAEAIETDRSTLPQQWIDRPHPRRIKRS